MPDPKISKLVDPDTGEAVHLVYAIPPELLGQNGEADQGLSLGDLVSRLRAGWKIIVGCTVLAAVIGLTIALTTPNRYTATATALPPPDKSGASGMLAQYAGLAAAAGINLPGTPTSSVDAIMAILSSRRLHEPLIERFALREYYQAETRDAVLGSFARDFSTRQDKKSNTISIAYTHRDPQVAADVTNAAADLLKATFNEINQSSAVRERIFLEGRLQATEAELLRAAKDLADFQSQKGAIEIESQTKASIEAVAKFQGELIAQQVELKALLASAASVDNPRIQLLQERVNAMTAELQRLLGSGEEGSGVLIGLGSLPELGIAYIEKYRAVKKFESVLTALTAQLEAARINEVRTSEVVTIVDAAFIPERKSGPPRAQICVAAVLLGLMAGSAVVLLRENLLRKVAH